MWMSLLVRLLERLLVWLACRRPWWDRTRLSVWWLRSDAWLSVRQRLLVLVGQRRATGVATGWISRRHVLRRIVHRRLWLI